MDETTGEQEVVNQNQEVGNDDVALKLKQLEELNAKLASTNDRLLSESKDNAEKYRKVRDAIEAKEKAELENSGKLEELLLRERDEKTQLAAKMETVQRAALDHKIAAEAAVYATDAYDIADVVEKVRKSTLLRVNEGTLEVEGMKEAIEEVRKSKPNFFKSGFIPNMGNEYARKEPPKEKAVNEMTGDEKTAYLKKIMGGA